LALNRVQNALSRVSIDVQSSEISAFKLYLLT
jgi:hypothetical protein